MRQAVNALLKYEAGAEDVTQKARDDLLAQRLTEKEIEVLRDVQDLLSLFHDAQQQVSFEHTPTLASVLPEYDLLLSLLPSSGEDPRFRHLTQAIDQAIEKLTAYSEAERQKPVYALALGVFALISLCYFGH